MAQIVSAITGQTKPTADKPAPPKPKAAPKITKQPAFVLENSGIDPDARRIEIDEFICDNAMTTLFLLALRQMMDPKLKPYDQEDWYTWYNISACHGFPEELWRGIENNTSTSNPQTGYYCTHGSTVFPTWHRCSVFMLEQAIHRKMVEIAQKYTEAEGRSKYIEATKRFRFPYWDPLLPRHTIPEGVTDQNKLREQFGFPDVLSMPSVWVKAPGLGTFKINNPLYRFDFPSSQEYRDSKRHRIRWNFIQNKNGVKMPEGTMEDHTLRAPSFSGISQHPELVKRVQAQAQGLAIAMWQVLNPGESENERQWDKFANHFSYNVETQDGWDDGVSLESWHDSIHTLVGAGTDGVTGHMGLLELAAFDPIFWLHHNNVERLFAIFQALYDDGEKGSKKFVAETKEGPHKWNCVDPIAPFDKGDGTCYNSEDVRDWTKLGYGVPGVNKLDDAGKVNVGKYIRDTYYWVTENAHAPKGFPYPKNLSKAFVLSGEEMDTSSFFDLPSVTFTELSAKEGLVDRDNPVDKGKIAATRKKIASVINPTLRGATRDDKPDTLFTWNVNIHVQKYAFEQSFEVHLFLDDYIVRTDPNWLSYPNQIGYTGIFASTPEADCDNCKDNVVANLIYTDTVSLGTILPLCLESNDAPDEQWPAMEMRRLKDLSEREVIPFLREHLTWRVRLTNQKEKKEKDMIKAGLKIVVTSRDFISPTDEKPLGVYHPITPHFEITAGKAGGSDRSYVLPDQQKV